MAILAFQKPDKVVMLENDAKNGKFEFRPLEPGFGTTVGNALRRILLSSLEGFAICAIKIDGVEHEFASVPGVKEDVTNIILKLKQVRFKQLVEEFETEKASITISNSTEFKAGDIGKQLSGFEVLNPELTICAKILIYHFMLFSDEKITVDDAPDADNEEFDEEVLHMRQLLKTKLLDMNLSVRALNCLKAADVETLGDLVQYNKNDLLKFRNFGRKSLTELDDLLESLNLSFGTDISKYKLDKD